MAKAKKQYTHLEMEAALCVWEQICDWTLLAQATRPEWVALRENVGSAEMRHQSIEIGKWCLEIYDILTKHDAEFFEAMAYDFEVIPMMLDYAENSDGEPVIYGPQLPDPHRVAQLVAHRTLLEQYLSDCRHEAQQQWKFGDLVRENPEDFIRGFQSGDDPKTLVKAIGEDLDLIDFGPWS